MKGYDITDLVDFVTQPNGSVDIRPKQSDWDILSAANRLGWEDPGFTETFDQTVRRAKEHLIERNRNERGHEPSKDCWCAPSLDYVDPITGQKTWVHHKTN